PRAQPRRRFRLREGGAGGVRAGPSAVGSGVRGRERSLLRGSAGTSHPRRPRRRRRRGARGGRECAAELVARKGGACGGTHREAGGTLGTRRRRVRRWQPTWPQPHLANLADQFPFSVVVITTAPPPGGG